VRTAAVLALALACTPAEAPTQTQTPTRTPTPTPTPTRTPTPTPTPASVAWTKVHDVAGLQAALDRARADRKAILLDVSATWCLPCKELHAQLATPAVATQLAERFAAIEIDVTDGTDEQTRIQALLASETLPHLLVYPSDLDVAGAFRAALAGTPMPPPVARVNVYVDADAVLAKITNVR